VTITDSFGRGQDLIHTEEVTGSIPVSPTRPNACGMILSRSPYNTEVQQPSAVQLAAERSQRLARPGVRHLGVDHIAEGLLAERANGQRGR